MAGHSKWKNIMHKKNKTDAQRAKVFTKIGKEMAMAVRDGGPDPVSNTRLRDLIAKAKANNVPNDNIERAIKKAGAGDGVNYESITYEGYGPEGVAVIVEAATDNRNRTGSDMKHYFDKYGGNLGQTGCVSYMFARSGVLIVEREGLDADKVMEDALDAGASDIAEEGEVYEILTAPADLGAVREALAAKGYAFLSAQEEMLPSTYATIQSEENVAKMRKLLELLDEHDDVQDVWHNWENETE